MDFRVAVNGPAAGNLFFCQGIYPCAFRQVNVALRATLLIDGGEEYVAAKEILILDLVAFFIVWELPKHRAHDGSTSL